MVTLIYTDYYRTTESGNWQANGSYAKIVDDSRLYSMIESCNEIGMSYNQKYNSFWMVYTDRLHALSIKAQF